LPSVYVGNLPKDFYDLDLFKFFKKHGYGVYRAIVHTKEDKFTKRTNRFGFLNFTSADEARRCQAEMNNTEIKGTVVRLSMQTNDSFASDANIIVRNLAPELSQDDLFKHFGQYGNIHSLKLETFHDGKSRGFCYI
jgi:RNA recognition motif-containing protein